MHYALLNFVDGYVNCRVNLFAIYLFDAFSIDIVLTKFELT